MSARAALCVLMAALMLCACAHKGGLKTPTQAALQEAKKAREAEKKAARAQEKDVPQVEQ